MSNQVPAEVMTRAHELQANIAGTRYGCDGLEAVVEMAYQAGRQASAEVCPYDCDPCHGDECPCPRAGCQGEPS